jgi:hypothetical protein
MSEPFHSKLAFVLKVLSVSRVTLAWELQVDKSLVGRWLTGAVKPSAHNLSRLSVYISQRVPGFSDLDWERSITGLAAVMGIDASPQGEPVTRPVPAGLAFPLIEESVAITARRGAAYEGFFRTTRPFPRLPGRFIHDHVLIRRDSGGNLGFEMTAGGVTVKGQVWLLHDQLFVAASEVTSGSFGYAILNGVSAVRAEVLDGIVLNCALDLERTPTASTIIMARIGEITDDAEQDHAKLVELGSGEFLAPEGSVPEEIVQHLNCQGFGEDRVRLAASMLSLPVSRSLARGV